MRLAIEENGTPDNWDIGLINTYDGGVKVYNFIKPHLKIISNCDKNSGCFAKGYKGLFNHQNSSVNGSYFIKGQLSNGVSFLVYSYGTGCIVEQGETWCASIQVDVNGFAPPNRFGVDYFIFTITNNGIIPNDGVLEVSGNGTTCRYQDSSAYNGRNCTAWVLAKENMDYRRRDVTEEWKKYKNKN